MKSKRAGNNISYYLEQRKVYLQKKNLRNFLDFPPARKEAPS